MTLAVCLRCGGKKVGAFTVCPGCGFEPKSQDESARSLLLSDHYLKPADLEEAGARIARGEDVSPPPELLAQVVQLIEVEKLKPGLGCTVVMWIPVVVMLALAGLTVFLFFQR
ncbi:MAG TPA: hypothetical protein VIG99_28530 [Myxococcaceae bacterium]|jgi:hypothetical protein